MTILRINVLGPLRLTVAGAARPLGGPQQRAVLAMLVTRRNYVVSTDALVDAVWPDDPPPLAASSLHVMISKLRGVLAGSPTAPKELLATLSPGYRLALEDDNLDVGQFQRLKKAGDQVAARGDHEQASARYAAALDQWGGEVLADLRGFRFAQEYAAPLERERLAAQVGHARAEINCGRPEGVLGELSSLTTAHPLHEPLWLQLITGLYLANHPADALEACRRVRAVLAEELGQDPGPPIQDIERRILRQEPLPGAAKPASVPLDSTLVDQDTATASLRDSAGRRYLVGPGALRIGRDADNHIALADSRVSRRHAAVTRTANGYLIRDQHSSNGTFVNGRQVDETAPLRHGDEVAIGGSTFVFEVSTG